VLGVWAYLLVFNLVLAWNFSPLLATADECAYVPVLTGDEPVTLGWVWRQHFEHRIPLAKLVWVGVLRLANYDFRLVNCLSLVGVGLLALALIWAVRTLRGRLTFPDAVFPLVILNPSQATNYLCWWQVNHLLAPLLGSAC
jgi:hypothetical protein